VRNQTQHDIAPLGGQDQVDGAAVGALECRIGRARFAIPTEAIGRLIEYRTWPLPLGRSWVGGVSLYAGAPLVSIALQRARPPGGSMVKGILLPVPGSPIGWALQIDEVFVFVRARLTGKREPGETRLPRWISIAVTEDGRSLAYVDVPGMLADVAGLPAAGEPA
jgi:hypothetical protein